MSKIQEALRKLQQDSSPKLDPNRAGFSAGKNRTDRSAIPIAHEKKNRTEGQKHPVSQKELIAGGLLAPLDLATGVADEFRRIKRPILDNASRKGPDTLHHQNVILVASAMPRAGKTFCAVNLAVSVSLERELNVLLIDADVAKPHISREFGMSGRPGLIDLLVGDSCDVSEYLLRTDLNDIQVLPAGKKHPQATELLASNRMTELISEVSERYPDRIILIDSPPLLITSEAPALAAQVGQIVLVVESGETTHQALAETMNLLDREKAINIILNKSHHSMKGGYYGEGYGYYGY